MSSLAVAWAWDHPVQDWRHRLLLVAVADGAQWNGEVVLRHKSLARMTGMTVAEVRKLVSELRAAGSLTPTDDEVAGERVWRLAMESSQ